MYEPTFTMSTPHSLFGDQLSENINSTRHHEIPTSPPLTPPIFPPSESSVSNSWESFQSFVSRQSPAQVVPTFQAIDDETPTQFSIGSFRCSEKYIFAEVSSVANSWESLVSLSRQSSDQAVPSIQATDEETPTQSSTSSCSANPTTQTAKTGTHWYANRTDATQTQELELVISELNQNPPELHSRAQLHRFRMNQLRNMMQTNNAARAELVRRRFKNIR